MDTMDGSALELGGKINVNAVINNDRHQVTDSVGHLDHKSKKLCG
jgi:hypothetical protein